MLLVVGATAQAIATAGAVAAQTGELVALDPTASSTALAAPLVSGAHNVSLPNGTRRVAELVVGPVDDFDAAILFTSPQDLHHRTDDLAMRLASVPTLYAPATFAGWTRWCGAAG